MLRLNESGQVAWCGLNGSNASPCGRSNVYRFLAIALLSVITMNVSHAGETSQTPAAGSGERSTILDAARAPVEKELGKPVLFVVRQLQVLNGWAFLHAAMQGPGGQPISYADTRFQQAAEHGAKSDKYMALLKQDHGHWQVQAFSIGPTDVAWAAWSEQYGAPKAIFPDRHP